MATVDVKFHCGCGYTTRKVEEAVRHCDKENHSLFVNGEIKKDDTK